ncbi:hypothetical protein M422DRAFT_784867 [Sphaerobolus stellatus SS14]|uniref:Fungal-type protein kinase domain-containing protein n=1 Tax=Sphaerobolus stellatus (strain SS14) TaxID=990650 RepID=A0A0C9UEV1_SPHS4|nr:hypothetical protein M422DRAFT_784867 [Sphaerobolus stellatus SS14]
MGEFFSCYDSIEGRSDVTSAEGRKNINLPRPSKDFLEKYLPPGVLSLPDSAKSDIEKQLKIINDAKNEHSTYAPISIILNTLSRIVYNELMFEGAEELEVEEELEMDASSDASHDSSLKGDADRAVMQNEEDAIAPDDPDTYISSATLDSSSQRQSVAVEGSTVREDHVEFPSLDCQESVSKGTASTKYPALVFEPWPGDAPRQDPHNARKIKPDILPHFSNIDDLDDALTFLRSSLPTSSLWKKKFCSPPAWSNLESAVEVKPHSVKGEQQACDYAQTLLMYRPDFNRSLVLSANQNSYYFVKADSLGFKFSDPMGWELDNLTPLYIYVRALYLCRGDDTSFFRPEGYSDIAKYPRWLVSFDSRNYDVDAVFARKSNGRRTWLAIGTEANAERSNDDIYVIKDMWRDTRRRFDEGSLLQKIHKDGFVPGVVRPISSGPVEDVFVEDKEGDVVRKREKRRLVMGTRGLPLSSCKTLLDFLKVMYDVIEAHQHVVERGVIHRDLSWFNILCRPVNCVEGLTLNRPCIGKLLQALNDSPDAETQSIQPCCLLTDFDNAAEIDSEIAAAELMQRTGTPMFIAIEMSSQELGHESIVPETLDPNLFKLGGKSHDLYMQHYETKDYDSFNAFLDAVAARTIPEEDPFKDRGSTVQHQPYHDIESILWVIMWFLIRACPLGASEDLEYNQRFESATSVMLNHRIGSDNFIGGRPTLLRLRGVEWRGVLHSKCASLIGMLKGMCMFMSMRWSRYPPMPRHYAHEAFKRLLLKEIVRMTMANDPIPIEGPRQIPNDKDKENELLRSLTMSRSRTTTTVSAGSMITSGESSRKRGRTGSMIERPQAAKRLRSVSQKPEPPEQNIRDTVIAEWDLCFTGDGAWFR